MQMTYVPLRRIRQASFEEQRRNSDNTLETFSTSLESDAQPDTDSDVVEQPATKISAYSMPDIIVWAPEEESDKAPICAFSSRSSLQYGRYSKVYTDSFDSPLRGLDSDREVIVVSRRGSSVVGAQGKDDIVSHEDVIAWTREILQNPSVRRQPPKPKTLRNRAANVLRTLGLLKKKGNSAHEPVGMQNDMSPHRAQPDKELDRSASSSNSGINHSGTIRQTFTMSKGSHRSGAVDSRSTSTSDPKASGRFMFTHRNRSTPELSMFTSDKLPSLPSPSALPDSDHSNFSPDSTMPRDGTRTSQGSSSIETSDEECSDQPPNYSFTPKINLPSLHFDSLALEADNF